MQSIKYMFLFWQHNYLRNWSLVVPVCMNELAITVAVWHTEFRTASWSDREKKQKAQEEAVTANSTTLQFIWLCKQVYSYMFSKPVILLLAHITFVFLRIIRSVLLFRIRNCKWSSMAISPLRILIILAFWSLGSSFYKNTEKQYNDLSNKSNMFYSDTKLTGTWYHKIATVQNNPKSLQFQLAFQLGSCRPCHLSPLHHCNTQKTTLVNTESFHQK